MGVPPIARWFVSWEINLWMITGATRLPPWLQKPPCWSGWSVLSHLIPQFSSIFRSEWDTPPVASCGHEPRGTQRTLSTRTWATTGRCLHWGHGKPPRPTLNVVFQYFSSGDWVWRWCSSGCSSGCTCECWHLQFSESQSLGQWKLSAKSSTSMKISPNTWIVHLHAASQSSEHQCIPCFLWGLATAMLAWLPVSAAKELPECDPRGRVEMGWNTEKPTDWFQGKSEGIHISLQPKHDENSEFATQLLVNCFEHVEPSAPITWYRHNHSKMMWKQHKTVLSHHGNPGFRAQAEARLYVTEISNLISL